MTRLRLWPAQRSLALAAAYCLITSPLAWTSLQQKHQSDLESRDVAPPLQYVIATEKRTDLNIDTENKHHKRTKDTHVELNDPSALQTFAPARQDAGNLAVRAPSPAKVAGRSNSAGASTLQHARSLQDWEVEDMILLATVDGSIYARDRKTGAHRWGPILAESPVVETIYHRENSSSGLQYQYDDSLNDFIWIVEPSRGGDIYLYNKAQHGILQRLNMTVKKLQEQTPWSSEEPAVAYFAEKTSTLMTFDAATGEWRQAWGRGNSRTNDKTTCRHEGFGGYQEQECGLMGRLTLGRVTYTIHISHGITAEPICTLKYSEWVPNSRDGDLHAQHITSMDQSYVYPKHDGQVFAMKHDDGGSSSFNRLWHQRLPSPVVRVFDVVKPANSDIRNSALVVLAQPVGPFDHETSSRPEIERRKVFVNHTTAGGWYALSEQTYPLITKGANKAPCYDSQWRAQPTQSRNLTHTELGKVLVGVHPLAGIPDTTSYTPPQIAPPLPIENNNSKLAPAEISLPSLPSPKKDGYYISKTTVNTLLVLSTAVSAFIAFCVYYLDRGKVIDIIRKQFAPSFQIPQTLSVPSRQPSPRVAGFSNIPEREDPVPFDRTKAYPEDDEAPSTDTVGMVPSPLPEEGAPPEPHKVPDSAESTEDPTITIVKAEPRVHIVEPGPIEHDPEQSVDQASGEAQEKEKKKARRGKRGGKGHGRKNKSIKGENELDQADGATSREDSIDLAVEKALEINNDSKHLEPDAVTVIPGGSDPTRVNDTTLQIGQLTVLEDKVLGYGSHGTCVFQGTFGGRDVAVKRILKHLYDIAAHEVTVLQESDDHPNVIRYYMMESAGDFMYIALELCPASLADMTERPHEYADLAGPGGLDMVDALRQITMGIRYLHSLKIVHRDIKPENILLAAPKRIPTRSDFVQQTRILISDFGLCKKLELNQSSFRATTAHAAGTSGWRAPELLVDEDNTEPSHLDTGSGTQYSTNSDSTVVDTTTNRRVTRAIDIFALGCVFYYVLSKGSHPFDGKGRGEGKYMREANIIRGNHMLDDLSVLGAYQGEAHNLISRMLAQNPKDRPDAGKVLAHPFFWSAADRLDFLCHVSDQFEFEPRDPPSDELLRLEMEATEVIQGCRDDFLRKLPSDFVATLGKQRKYKGDHMLDLLRALRNKKNHYEDMPDSVKTKVGSLPEGYLLFWTERFPKLLMRCHQVVKDCGWESKDRFRKYYSAT